MVTAATGQPELGGPEGHLLILWLHETGLNLLSEAGSWGSSHWVAALPSAGSPYPARCGRRCG